MNLALNSPLVTVVLALVAAILLAVLIGLVIFGREMLLARRTREQHYREFTERTRAVPRTPPGRPFAPPGPSPRAEDRPGKPTR